MQRIFRFSGAECDWTGSAAEAKTTLGGKGAGLVMMANAQMPVPPGFTITTAVCKDFEVSLAPTAFLNALMAEADAPDEWLAEQFGYHPLVSIRSGAPVSMPGMMDTILNVGITESNLHTWMDRIGERAALDSYRRLIQMLGSTAYGVPHQLFEDALAHRKQVAKVTEDWQLNPYDLNMLVDTYLAEFKAHTGHEFPQTRTEQMRAGVAAVFNSWQNPRAIEYRKINKIDAAMGTAVTVQAMVFGNTGENSGSGVLFTRNPSTGEPVVMAEYLANAQGEDVVAGIRTPDTLQIDVTGTGHDKPWMDELAELVVKLEEVYADMVDIEFTVQDGKLFLLQSRTGKRSARAAFKIAVDLETVGMITAATALSRLTVDQFKVVRRPSIDPTFKTAAHQVGLPACPGVVVGRPVYSAQDAINCTEPCVLVTHETTPDDIAGMNAAVGILTQTGGATSHAAVVARAMDKSCVVGCTTLNIQAMKDSGIDRVTLDGATGKIWFQTEVPVIDSTDAPEIKTVGQWCLHTLNVCEAVPVQNDTENLQTVMAAAWWGSEEVLDAMLNDLADLPSRAHIALDMRSPMAFADPADMALASCFEPVGAADPFLPVLVAALADRAHLLAGMALHNVPTFAVKTLAAYPQADTDWTASIPASVPVDFAIFQVLGA